MLYTGKGDDGTTYFFGSKKRFGKHTPLVEALGTLDELNSLLGLIRAKVKKDRKEIEQVQQDLFIIQAELAGADMKIEEKKVRDMERRIGEIEKRLPVIKTFFIPGASEQSALYDYARTVARRAERRVVALKMVSKLHKGAVSVFSLAYLNRLSSLLYAHARLAALGRKEKKPNYS